MNLVRPAHALGPTWTRHEDGSWFLPTWTLGWGVLAWGARFLRQPDGPDAGRPFRLTPEQARFVLWWYAIDETGRFLFRSGVLRRLKGWGKDPVGAFLALAELAGPVVFSHWVEATDAANPVAGRRTPVGKPHPYPWVQVAAVSRDQTRNTLTLFPGMVSPDLERVAGLDVHKEVIHKAGGGRAEAVTSSPKSLEGGRSTFVLQNETQFWLPNNAGHDMDNAISGNLAKGRGGGARRLAICNAHVPGEDSIGERDYDAALRVEAGSTQMTGFLYDSIEAPASTDLSDRDSLIAGLEVARGDSTWLDVSRLAEEVVDLRTPPSEARRKYLNQVVAPEDSWTSPYLWDACELADAKLEDGEVVALGFDGSRTDDSSALVACRSSDGCLFLLGVWENPGGSAGANWEVPREEVDEAVHAAFSRYRVRAFYSDVNEWESYVENWGATYRRQLKAKASPRNSVAWDMRTKGDTLTRSVMAMEGAIRSGELLHDGNRVLRRHVLNARRRMNRWGVTFGKEHRESSRKVDALAAALLARMAWQDLVQTGKARIGQQKRGRVIVLD